MKRLTARRVNGIKTGYWSAAKKDSLIQRLGELEERLETLASKADTALLYGSFSGYHAAVLHDVLDFAAEFSGYVPISRRTELKGEEHDAALHD